MLGQQRQDASGILIFYHETVKSLTNYVLQNIVLAGVHKCRNADMMKKVALIAQKGGVGKTVLLQSYHRAACDAIFYRLAA